MIYVVHILEGQFIKIGYCKNSVEARIAALQTGCPFEIKKLFVVDGSLTQEKELHKVLTATLTLRRLQVPPNEWYIGSHAFFMGFLINLAESANIGLAYLDDYYDDKEKQNKYEVKLFKYGTKESIENYLEKGLKGKAKVGWPCGIKSPKSARSLSRTLVAFFEIWQ